MSSWMRAAAFGGLPGHRGPLSLCPRPPAHLILHILSLRLISASRQSLYLCCRCSPQAVLSDEISVSIIESEHKGVLHQP